MHTHNIHMNICIYGLGTHIDRMYQWSYKYTTCVYIERYFWDSRHPVPCTTWPPLSRQSDFQTRYQWKKDRNFTHWMKDWNCIECTHKCTCVWEREIPVCVCVCECECVCVCACVCISSRESVGLARRMRIFMYRYTHTLSHSLTLSRTRFSPGCSLSLSLRGASWQSFMAIIVAG